MQDQKALLDSLMGNDRNFGKKEKKDTQSWKDNVICKNHLVWECPHEFFLNETGRAAPKAPFGECPKQHSEAMRLRFQADSECRKYKFRYFQDLELQMRRKIEAMDKKVEAEKEVLSKKLEAEKDKLDAPAATLEPVSITATALGLPPTDERARRKEQPDEMCEVCGTYTSFRGAAVMRHDAGITHVGWARLRESYARLQKEIQAMRDAAADDPIEAVEVCEQVTSGLSDSNKSRDQKWTSGKSAGDDRSEQDHKSRRRDRDMNSGQDRDWNGRADLDGRGHRDRNRDRDRGESRVEHDHKNRGRDRDAHSGRDHDSHGHGRDRDRDRGQGRRHERQDRSRRRDVVDEFGRAKTIADDYREREVDQDRECDRRGRDNRSRSRDNGKRGDSPDQDTQDLKTFRIQFSNDWEDMMGRKIAEMRLRIAEWDMTVFDCKGGVIKMDAEEVSLSIHSFPLKFKFTRKL